VDALLAAMTPPPPPAGLWRWVALAIGGLGSAAAATVLLRGRGTLPDPTARCATTPRVEAWTADRRAAVATTLATREADAADDIARTLATLDAYAAGWASMRRDVCLATDPAQPALLAGRVECLDQRAWVMTATVELIVRDPDMTPLDAAQVAGDLHPVDRCGQSRAIAITPRTPALDAARAELAALETRTDDRWAELVAATARIATLGDPGLYLDALLLEAAVGTSRGESIAAEAAARRAIAIADSLPDDLARAHAGALLTRALAAQNRIDEARGTLPQAEAALARGGAAWEVAIEVAKARAAVARADNDVATELAARRQIFDQEHQHRLDDARAVTNAAIELTDAAERAGRGAEAADAKALLDRVASSDPDDPTAAMGRAVFAANEARSRGDLPRAIEQMRYVVAMYRELEIPTVGDPLLRLAQDCVLAGEWNEAHDRFREAAAAFAEGDDRDEARVGLASMQLELGNASAALATARAVLAHDRDPSRRRAATLLAARALLATHHPGAVVPLLEPVARELDADAKAPRLQRALAAWVLAQSLWATGGPRERDRARALAADAVRDLDAAIVERTDQPRDAVARQQCEQHRADVIAWQDRHP